MLNLNYFVYRLLFVAVVILLILFVRGPKCAIFEARANGFFSFVQQHAAFANMCILWIGILFSSDITSSHY